MNWMKRTAIVIATGAALSLPASINASAAPIGQAAGMTNTLNGASSAAQSDSNLIEVGRRGYRRHGGWGRHRGWGRRHGYYRRHRGHNGWGLAAGLLAAPLIYGAYDRGYYGYGYGYGGGSCYRECRFYHGPRYCRWNAHRYC